MKGEGLQTPGRQPADMLCSSTNILAQALSLQHAAANTGDASKQCAWHAAYPRGTKAPHHCASSVMLAAAVTDKALSEHDVLLGRAVHVL